MYSTSTSGAGRRYQQQAPLASPADSIDNDASPNSYSLRSQLDSLSPTTASHVGTSGGGGGAQFLPAMEESVASSSRGSMAAADHSSARRSRSTSRRRSSTNGSNAYHGGGGVGAIGADDAESRSTRGRARRSLSRSRRGSSRSRSRGRPAPQAQESHPQSAHAKARASVETSWDALMDDTHAGGGGGNANADGNDDASFLRAYHAKRGGGRSEVGSSYGGGMGGGGSTAGRSTATDASAASEAASSQNNDSDNFGSSTRRMMENLGRGSSARRRSRSRSRSKSRTRGSISKFLGIKQSGEGAEVGEAAAEDAVSAYDAAARRRHDADTSSGRGNYGVDNGAWGGVPDEQRSTSDSYHRESDFSGGFGSGSGNTGSRNDRRFGGNGGGGLGNTGNDNVAETKRGNANTSFDRANRWGGASPAASATSPGGWSKSTDNAGGGSVAGSDKAVYPPGVGRYGNSSAASASPGVDRSSAPAGGSASVASVSTPSKSGGGGDGGGGKVARLASLFSSRSTPTKGPGPSSGTPGRSASVSSAAAAATSSTQPPGGVGLYGNYSASRTASDAVSSPTMSTTNSAAFPASPPGDTSSIFENHQLHEQSIQEDSSLASSAATSSHAGLPAAGSASFIRRRTQHHNYASSTVPASPVHSAATGYSSGGGSAAYVGWPGTQTKDGQTVEIKQTFSESDTSGLHRPPSSAGGGASSVGRGGGFGGSGQWIDAGDVMGSDESDLEGDDDDLPRQPQMSDQKSNPADYHLAAALADVRAAATPHSRPDSSPMKSLRPSPIDAPPYHTSQNERGASFDDGDGDDDVGRDAILHVGSPFAPPSPSSKSKRKQLPVAGGGQVPDGIDISGSASRVLASGRSSVTSPEKALPRSRTSSSPMSPHQIPQTSARRQLNGNSTRSDAPQPLSEAALREQEKRSPAPPRVGKINARNVRGYRGFFDKTQDVPNLMDAEDSESIATETTAPDQGYGMTAAAVAGQRSAAGRRAPSSANNSGGFESSSDVFDGLSDAHGASRPGSTAGFALNQPSRTRGSKGQAVMNIIRRSQSSTSSMTGGPSKSNGPRSLTHQNLMAATSPSKALAMDRANYDGATSQADSSLADYSLFYISADAVRKLVRKYRKMTTLVSSYPDADIDAEEDAKKAFALFEMRSRIMETDIDRGLERCGGTIPVDDLVTTPYAKVATRIRDAVVVSKAWRDGATPRDVMTASMLTRRDTHTFYTVRQDDYGRSFYEPVGWVDDTDFEQMRCPSLGPRCMRGFEMFTIGDCQSILLKLTHERCQQLQSELQLAILRQLSAERGMKEEEGNNSAMFDDSGMMSEAEMTYLEAMESVKDISKRLVYAESAFELVKERIEALISRYEDFLIQMEDDESLVSFDASSYTQSDFSSQVSSSIIRNKEMLTLRAKRAEVMTEMQIREGQQTQPTSVRVIEKKQKELDSLQ